MPRRTHPALPTDPVAAFTILASAGDPTLVAHAESYKPRFPDASWPTAAPQVALGILAAAPRSWRKASAAGLWCTIHVNACLDRGASRTVTGVWGYDAVETTLATMNLPERTAASMATTLRRASAVLAPRPLAPGPRQHPRATNLPPYTSDELADVVDAATTITSPLWRARVCLLITLHAGAGLRAGEVSLVNPSCVSVDDRGVLVRVPGARERLVPVRVELEQLAAATRAAWTSEAPDGQLLAPRDPGSRCFEGAPWPFGLARLSSARLRATWTTWVLAGGASVQAFLAAADITSTDSWYAPVRLLADLDQTDYLHQVRGTSLAFSPANRTLDGQPWPAPAVPLRADTPAGGGR